MKKHELLAPAGSYEIAKAVIDAGADAVYLGGDKFGARALAANLDRTQILEILDYAHLRGCALNLTVNTLLKNREIEEQLYEYLLPLYEAGLDACIVQDFGVLRLLVRNFPKMAVHASTQMSVSGVEGARFLKECGASRIVTARELSLPEIRKIYDATGLEIESFIHGALCYCYSGQCLMSSLIGGRSGNRGRCAQPCRLPYRVAKESGRGTEYLTEKERYPLSPKDLCTIDLLPELSAAGIFSFKIEGRMKQLEYAAGVTAVYRKYLDLLEADPEAYRVDEADRKLLLDLGNRSGFTDGYYRRHNGPEMLADQNPSHQSGKNPAPEKYARKKEPVQVYCRAHAGEPILLTVSAGDVSAAAEGPEVMQAQKRPLSEADLRKQICKTGDTAYETAEFIADLGENAFLPVSALNELRRNAYAQLDAARLASYRREKGAEQPLYASAVETDAQPEKSAGCDAEAGREGFAEDMPGIANIDGSDGRQTVVVITEPEMLSTVLDSGLADRIDLDYPKGTETELLKRDLERIHDAGVLAGYCMPYVFRDYGDYVQNRRAEGAASLSFDRYIARSYDSLGWLTETAGIPAERIVTDYNVYVFSRETAAAFAQKGIGGYTVSYELNKKEMMHQQGRGAELPVYGSQPLMISAQCVYKNYDRCRKTGSSMELSLEDRYHHRFPVLRDCSTCYNVIYNAMPLSLMDEAEAVKKLPYRTYKLSFTQESPEAIRNILEAYRAAFFADGSAGAGSGKGQNSSGRSTSARDRSAKAVAGKRNNAGAAGITHGHFHRGVE